MTKGKARANVFNAFAEKLKRIWVQEQILGGKPKWTVDQWSNFRFKASITTEITLELTGGSIFLTLTRTESKNTESERFTGLGCRKDTGHIEGMEMTRKRHEVGQYSRDGQHSEISSSSAPNGCPSFGAVAIQHRMHRT
ncbi:hypothetical protein IAD21_05063 [Abditibacteriota bacterium]|nr:hypothetical protein IAD21_05063 [Abditibacteriota bacterium]